MDAIDWLTAQHRQLETRLEAAMAAEGDVARAQRLAEVGDHLSVHMASEEQVFYPAVREHRTEDILLESLEEHLSLKRLLADLLELEPGAPTFKAKLEVLSEQAEHHHKEEEEKLFPKVRKVIDEDALDELGERMMELQRQMQREGAPREQVADQTDAAAPLR